MSENKIEIIERFPIKSEENRDGQHEPHHFEVHFPKFNHVVVISPSESNSPSYQVLLTFRFYVHIISFNGSLGIGFH